MVFFFADLLTAVFVSHDYSSGFEKNIFTIRAKKLDYVASKNVIGVFGGAGMIAAYVLGAAASGFIMGKSFEGNAGSLLMCLLSIAFLMGVFCSLFLSIAVFLETSFG